MATVKKSKKAQYGEHLTQDRATGKYTLTTKSNTPDGPRYYQSTSPNESTNRTINNFKARANSADSVRAKDIDPKIIARLAEQKNGGKTKKYKSGGKLAAGVGKKGPKAGLVDPKGAYTKVQKRTLGKAKTGTKMKKK